MYPRRSSLLVALLLTVVGCAAPDPAAVTFRVDMRAVQSEGRFDPETDTVGLRGGVPPLSWSTSVPAADPDGDGWYEVTVDFDRTDSVWVPHKFKVDGRGGPNSGWEPGRNHTVRLGGAAPQVSRRFGDPPAPMPPTHTGTIERIEDVAGAGLAPRDLHVYLPPGYTDDPERRYPVLYMHDGQNVFDAAAAGDEWGLDETAERLIRAGAIQPMIIVGVANTPARMDEYTPPADPSVYTLRRIADAPFDAADPRAGRYALNDSTYVDVRAATTGLTLTGPLVRDTLRAEAEGDAYVLADRPGRLTLERGTPPTGLVLELQQPGGGGDAYGRLLVEHVKPLIDQRYRTRSDASHTGLGGSSLGGLITSYLGLHYPDTFGTLLIVSPSVWWADEVILTYLAEHGDQTGQYVWVDMGTSEGPRMLDGARKLRDAYVALGWQPETDLVYEEFEGAGHNEGAWADRAEAMLRFFEASLPE